MRKEYVFGVAVADMPFANGVAQQLLGAAAAGGVFGFRFASADGMEPATHSVAQGTVTPGAIQIISKVTGIDFFAEDLTNQTRDEALAKHGLKLIEPEEEE